VTPQLACAVLSYRDEPFLVDAVRSVLQQDVPVEVVVVNSGGGDPARRLSSASIDVPVHSVVERLYPGAVRNVGIAMTRAPYMSFLAADCLATSGWAAGRLRAHRAGAAAVASPTTNPFPESYTAWASLLLQHNRRLAVTSPRQRLYYSLSYDRALFERFGRFREDLRAGEDTEFNARFRDQAEIVLGDDVLTAHRYPTELAAMVRDAYRRGSLQARMQGAIDGSRPQRIQVAMSGPRNVVRSLVVSLRTHGPDRARLLTATPLVVVGAVAYSVGALFSTTHAHSG